MPAINVARTDTFEQQRVKINEIAEDLFDLTGGSGGATISPAGVSLQDGTKSAPALTFQSDNKLGLYKNNSNTIGFVSNDRLAFTYNDYGTYFENNLFVRNNFLDDTYLSITETGSEYDVGTYPNVALFGGSGVGAEATVVIAEYNGQETTNSNVDEYVTGIYSNIPLGGGTGSNAAIDFQIVTTEVATKGIIQNGGTEYFPGIYTNVALDGGVGNGKIADIEVTGSITFNSTISNAGTGYVDGTYPSVPVDNVPTQTINLTVAQRKELLFTYGRRYEWNVTDDGANTNFVFSGATSGNNVAITVQEGDYLVFNINASGHPFYLQSVAGPYDPANALIAADGVTNNGTDSGTIIFDTSEVFAGTYYYVCGNHGSMTGTITIGTNTGNSFAVGDTIVGASGSGTVVNFSDQLGALYFSSITGSFTVGEEFTAAGAYGIVKAVVTDKYQYLLNGTDTTALNTSVNYSQTILLDTSDASNSGYDIALTDDFGVTLDNTIVRLKNYGTPGLAGAYSLLTITPEVTNQSITGLGLTPSTGPDGRGIIFAISATPAIGQYILDQTANVEVSGGSIISWDIATRGTNWKSGDQVTVDNSYLGGTGSGALVAYTSVTIVGTVTNVTITTEGTGYVEGDILSFNNSITGNSGSGFEYRISNRRAISDIVFANRGTGYVVGDILRLPPDPGNYGGDDGFEFEITKEGTLESITITDPGRNYYTGDVLQLDRTALVANPAGLSGNEIEASIAVTDIDSTIPITISNTGALSVTGSVTSTTVTADTVTGNTSVTSPLGTFTNLEADNILPNSTNNLSVSSPLGILNIDAGNIYIGGINGTTVTVVPLTGNVTTTGVLKTTNELNVNNILSIVDNNISVVGSGDDLLLTPDATKVVKVDANSALTIPVGSTAARPPLGFAADGQIRFNTDTNQYEGYSATNTSWSSLGGIRDLDGNTYILAEQTVGANDNTLWFYNDGDNTVRFTPFYQEFVEVKKVRSVNVTAPVYVNWTANTPVVAGDYLKYKHDIYIVISPGTTGVTQDPPTDTSGNTFTNGTATLQYSASAVADLTFEEIGTLKIGPDTDVPLSISSDLRLVGSTVSTDVSDLTLAPNTGKKVVVDANTTLAIPAGTTAERGIPIQGSIRFNTTTFTYEGYDGTNWGSLGGVKDVDQNTYIIPETAPGANENTLFFYNDGNNTVNLTTANLEMRGVDSISSPVSNILEFTASTILFDSATTTLDNTAVDTTFLHTSKQYFDLGLSSGLNTDPVLRLDDQGDVYFNIGFGTGTFSGVKVFDGELKDFELADYQIVTETINLDKGTIDSGSADLYTTSVAMGSKVTVFANNATTGEREFIEYAVIDNGTDAFHTEYGNVRSSGQLISTGIELTGAGIVRINIDLDASVAANDLVNIKVISQLTKK